MKIIHLCKVDVIEFKQKFSSFFLKLKVVFIDNSVLFTKEYFDTQSRNYSYYWQSDNEELIMRWDNAPHHKNISTFPHHVHLKENRNIRESNVIVLIEVLVAIIEETDNDKKNQELISDYFFPDLCLFSKY